MICPQCGKEIPDNSNFCVFCQADLRVKEPAQANVVNEITNTAPENNTTAVSGKDPDKTPFILAIISLGCAVIGFRIAAIVLAIIALIQCSNNRKIAKTSKNTATLIMSIIALAAAGFGLIGCAACFCGGCNGCFGCAPLEDLIAENIPKEFSNEINFDEIFSALKF